MWHCNHYCFFFTILINNFWLLWFFFCLLFTKILNALNIKQIRKSKIICFHPAFFSLAPSPFKLNNYFSCSLSLQPVSVCGHCLCSPVRIPLLARRSPPLPPLSPSWSLSSFRLAASVQFVHQLRESACVRRSRIFILFCDGFELPAAVNTISLDFSETPISDSPHRDATTRTLPRWVFVLDLFDFDREKLCKAGWLLGEGGRPPASQHRGC